MKHLPASSRAGFLLLALAVAACLPAQGPAPADLDAWVARAMKEFDVPGASVAIVKDGQVAVARGYGIRKLGEPAPVDERTLFAIASNTKAFTAAALAILVDEGRIAWDDPVWQRLPGFQMYDPYVSKELTIRDLLTHRSGLGLGEGDLLFWPQTTYTRDDLVQRLRHMKPASSLRSRYAYNNLMYVAAGQVIPAVTGKSWDEFVEQRILVPLGMKDTRTGTVFKDGDQYAWPHSRLATGRLEACALVMGLDNAGPAGSIMSSAGDLAKWMMLQLDAGRIPGGDRRLFSEKQSREMWSAQTILPIRENPAPLRPLQPRFSSYGLGWFLRDYHGRKLVTHTGGAAGYVSRVMLVPEEKLGIVVLTNAEEGGAFDSIVYHALDHAFGVPASDWISVLKSARDVREQEAKETEAKAAAARARDTKPSLSLEKYAATYADAWYGQATIRLEGEKLVLSMDHTPTMSGELEHWQYDTFRTRWRDRTIADAFVTFSLKPDGSIEQFKMAAVSPLADFSFDYQDLLFRPAAAQDSAPASRPAGSGGLLAFTRGGNVWVLGADGRGEKQLTTGQAYDRPVSWTPDGARVIYWKHHEDWHLWSVDAASGAQADLTPDGGDCRSATVSPDGKLIAFMSGRDGFSLMNADGSKRRVLSKLGHRDAPPAWSPDASRLAFVHLRQAGEHQVALDIHVMGLETAEPPPFVMHAEDPAWSRDGRALLYLAHRKSPTADLFALDVATKAEKNLTSTPDLNESAFSVSPDGRRIAVIAHAADWKSSALRVLDADGANAKQLVKIEGRPALPSWSPDSKRIALSQGPPGKANVWVIDAASGQATQVTREGGDWAAWQPR